MTCAGWRCQSQQVTSWAGWRLYQSHKCLAAVCKNLRTKIRTWQKVANSDQFCTKASSRHANFVDDIKRGSAELFAKVRKESQTNIAVSQDIFLDVTQVLNVTLNDVTIAEEFL